MVLSSQKIQPIGIVPQKGRLKKDNVTYFVFSLPGLILWSAFIFIPIILGFYYAMTDWNGISLDYNFIGLNNFISLISDERVHNSLKITFIYTIITTTIITVLSIFLANILNNARLKCRALIRSIFFFPAVLSMITVGLIFSQILSKPIPVIGEALGINWMSSNLLASQSTALIGIMIVHLWHGTAVPTVMYMAGLQSIPEELNEAAILDGATILQQFRYITLPFLIPVMKVSLVLLVKAGITQFDYIKVTTMGGPGHATETVSALIMDQAFSYSMKYGYAISEAIMLFIILIIITLIQFNVLGRKEVGQQ
ncbi:MAG: carbohydrate ABC transporter permease [Ruminiclostridium sp.]